MKQQVNTMHEIISQIYNFSTKRTNSRIVQLMSAGDRPYLVTSLEKICVEHNIPNNIPIGQRVWHLVHSVPFGVLCANCHTKSTKFNGPSRGYQPFCSVLCGSSSVERKAKTLATVRKKYGVDNIGQVTSINEKRKATNLVKYGVEYPLQNTAIQQKTVATQVAKYGASGFACADHLDKAKQSLLDRFGVASGNAGILPHQTEFLANKQNLIDLHLVQQLTLTEIATIVGVSVSTVIAWFKRHEITNRLFHQSSEERVIQSYLLSKNISFETNNRQILKPQELDIYIPTKNIAIEIDGLWYHSERNAFPKGRHLDKTSRCLTANIRLLHLFDYEIKYKLPQCVSLISSAIGCNKKIGARKLHIQELSPRETSQFLNDNHMQGAGISPSVSYGLVSVSGEVIACMTFGQSRFNSKSQWELLRYCNLLNTTVAGGAGKLFQHFLKQQSPQSITSYCDKRLFTGSMYSKLGFELSHVSKPNYWYFSPKQDRLYHRSHFQKHKLAAKFPDNFDSNQSEWQIMSANNWNRVWDCGNNVYHWVAKA